VRVLVAEDDAISRLRLQKRLADWGYEVTAVDDGERAWAALQVDDPPQLAILDWMMPKLDGPEICRRLRSLDTAQYTYVILLTGKNSKEDIVSGLEAGADDYVTKPFDAQELEVRLRIGRRIIAMQQELRFRATRDPLTGALNRGAAVDMLRRELARSERSKEAVSVILADVDHFKRINDAHGHLGGDDVLRETVHRMSGSVRTYDVVGRYGGEEFLIVLPNCEEVIAAAVAERLRRSMASAPFVAAGGSIAVSASFGVACHRAGETIEKLIGRADAALYGAKAQGRNCVVTAGSACAEDGLPPSGLPRDGSTPTPFNRA